MHASSVAMAIRLYVHLLVKSMLKWSHAPLSTHSLKESRSFDKDHYLACYIDYMVSQKDKDQFIDKYHIEYFERFAVGNKPYYSAGIGKGASEATSRGKQKK